MPGYTLSQWAGRDNYECNYCPTKTLSKADIDHHLFYRHGYVEGQEVEPANEPELTDAEQAEVDLLVKANTRDELADQAAKRSGTKKELAVQIVLAKREAPEPEPENTKEAS